MKRFLAIGMVGGLGLLLTGPATVSADSVSVAAKPSVPGNATYVGKVNSGKSRCTKARRVLIYHDSEPPFLIGETTTDADGNYSFEGISPPPGDDVFVVVKKKGKGSKKCKSVTASTTVR